MIYIIEEFNDGKWWTVSAHPTEREAVSARFNMLDKPYGGCYQLRIRIFDPKGK